jgi:hypothetical protein
MLIFSVFTTYHLCECSEDCADLLSLRCAGVGLVVSRNIGKYWRFLSMDEFSSTVHPIVSPEYAAIEMVLYMH